MKNFVMLIGTIIFIFCQTFLLTESTRPRDDIYTNPFPSIIYLNQSPVAPGDACNYNHFQLPASLEVPFGEWDKPCGEISTCELVFDKYERLIPLSIEAITVKGFKYDIDDPSETPNDLKMVIYYKKCVCPPDSSFNFIKATCTDPNKGIAPGVFCGSKSPKTGTKIEIVMLSIALSLSFAF